VFLTCAFELPLGRPTIPVFDGKAPILEGANDVTEDGIEAELEPEAVVDVPEAADIDEAAETDEAELWRVRVCWEASTF
jgi:hypothetical protein